MLEQPIDAARIFVRTKSMQQSPAIILVDVYSALKQLCCQLVVTSTVALEMPQGSPEST
jgi:hypothetical protein